MCDADAVGELDVYPHNLPFQYFRYVRHPEGGGLGIYFTSSLQTRQ